MVQLGLGAKNHKKNSSGGASKQNDPAASHLRMLTHRSLVKLFRRSTNVETQSLTAVTGLAS